MLAHHKHDHAKDTSSSSHIRRSSDPDDGDGTRYWATSQQRRGVHSGASLARRNAPRAIPPRRLYI
eukprot:6077504-Pyramimonas_sp.AAC.1